MYVGLNGLSNEDFLQLTGNLNTPVGIRNHAILLLLSRLGLRAQDIVNLRIDDIDWHDGSIRVTGKSARTANLPLPQDVGDALLLYIEKARPRATEERVFMQGKIIKNLLTSMSSMI